MALVDASTEVRELAVCLAVADVTHGFRNRLNTIPFEDDELDENEEQPDGWVYYDNVQYIADSGEEIPLKMLDIPALYEQMGGSDILKVEGISAPITRDDVDAMAVFYDGKAFADAIRSYGILGVDGPLACESLSAREWRYKSLKLIAKNNYALGLMIADYFGFYEGSLEAIQWMGPDILRGIDRWLLPPADVGFKLAGAPRRDYDEYDQISTSQVSFGTGTYVGDIDYGEDDPEESDYDGELMWQHYNKTWEHFDEKFQYYDTDCDIMVSLKDGSAVLGNLGFAEVANMMLEYDSDDYNKNFFLQYAPDEFIEWFNTAWDLLIAWINVNGSFKYDGATGKYFLGIEDQAIHLRKELYKGGTKESILDNEFPTYEELCRQTNKKTRKAFSYWCTQYGNKNDKYIRAQKRCAAKASYEFAMAVAQGIRNDRLHMLVGWRPTEYYYAKYQSRKRDEPGSMSIYAVPSIASAELYPFRVYPDAETLTVAEEFDEAAIEPTSTQTIVPFSLIPDWEYDRSIHGDFEAHFQFKIRHTDGVFNGPPIVQLVTKGEYVGTYCKMWEVSPDNYELQNV